MNDNSPRFEPVEFHLQNDIRRRINFTDDLYEIGATPVRPDFARIQTVAHSVEQTAPNSGVLPAELFALAVIDQLYCALIQIYRLRIQPAALDQARETIAAQLGRASSQDLLREFAGHFSPTDVLKGRLSLSDYLAAPRPQHALRGAGENDALVRLMLVYADNQNPACARMRSLFDDRTLPNPVLYQAAVSELREYFRAQPDIGIGGLSLFDALELPGKVAPGSLFDQLEFMQKDWSAILPAEYIAAAKLATDLIREEAKRGGTDFRVGKGDAPVPDFQAQLTELRRTMFGTDRKALRDSENEPEQFSDDTDWMPRAVVMAKSIYVWLDQLSKKYQYPIRRLDQIPDTELNQLAAWGFNGLWLIGLWQRSPASKQIKHLRGNPDAVASAYSIYDYVINEDLGGEPALEFLRERAREHGIRLASDLVPNHMGIDSRWLHEHSSRFLQTDTPPYPAYRFTGPNLSSHSRYEIRIEDGYWDQSDAAVVFQLHDHFTGKTRYVYHGNDGTSFPWNDTAQLDFLNPETREAVIQLIVAVAKRFPILRFDAAMTLTKKHYQRLWYPEPGSGGAIPSRALAGMSREQFDHWVPTEFWRDVVDRIAAEAPNTLLIAEAFWLTEGFFVRTLGMHRVYNSAFMNMLKHEENGKYRQVIRNTVEFDARILQRYVNFMNNPDEDTAVAQFGKGDKYFGVAVMMATLPGLPMFGHGQIEGFVEKYGHEYQRAYINEMPDDELIRRHEREIFPLLAQRDLFAGADHFMLYDLDRDDGSVDDDVFVYSNRIGSRAGLVIFLNRYAHSSGCIRRAGAIPKHAVSVREQRRISLAEGLGLRAELGLFYAARDQISGMEFLYDSNALQQDGLRITLHAYECRVLLDFRELKDDADGKLAQLCAQLNGRGMRNLEREFLRMFMAPLIRSFEHFCAPELLEAVANPDLPDTVLHELVVDRASDLIQELARFSNGREDFEAAQRSMLLRLDAIAERRRTESFSKSQCHTLTAWACASFFAELRRNNGRHATEELRQFDWLIHESIRETLLKLSYDGSHADYLARAVVILVQHRDALLTGAGIRRFSRYSDALTDPRVQDFLGCHRANNVVWFRKEDHNEFVSQLAAVTQIETARNEPDQSEWRDDFELPRLTAELEDLAAISEYDFGRFMTLLSYAGSRKPVVRTQDKQGATA